MKIIIAGSRDITDYNHVINAMDKALEYGYVPTEIVSGGCEGIDRLGESWGAKNKLPIKKFPANWKKLGSAAGPIRNGQMAKYADCLVAIMKKEGSKGTQNMIDQANKAGLKIVVWRV
jgi:hypothetical protein